MIRLKPAPETHPRSCPLCGGALAARGWLIPGMRNLADLQCPKCGKEFYADLPAGQALYTPMMLEKESGEIAGGAHPAWFSDWLTQSYARRTSEPLGFEVRKTRETKDKVILLNCLDTLYGHSLLKLLNAQYYIDNCRDAGLILLVPRFLEWMLPDGFAEAWIVDLPLRRGTEWNDWLAAEIAERLKSIHEAHLSVAFSHPHAESFDIERFTRVSPLPLEALEQSGANPTVTFIWRDDRLWGSNGPTKISRIFGTERRESAEQQTRNVIEFAERLRDRHQDLDFAVAGLGEAKGLPGWISDLRLTELNAEAERSWCERYAKSHFVIGVHGSNMLLPSAHAGGVIELIGEDRWGNYLQDILFRHSDPREMLFRYRFVPLSIGPEELATIADTMLHYGEFRRLMAPEFCRHGTGHDLDRWRSGGSRK